MCTLVNEIYNTEQLTTPFDLWFYEIRWFLWQCVNKQTIIAVKIQHNVSLAAYELISIFFTYEKGVLDFLGRCLSKTTFAIGWRMEVSRLSFFLEEIQDKSGFNNTGPCIFILTKAVLLLWFFTVTCSCCPYLYFGSAIMLVTYFVSFR